MVKHPRELTNYGGSLEDIAGAVSRLKPINLAQFIDYLSHDIDRQAQDDYLGGRVKLYGRLIRVAEILGIVSDKLCEACEKPQSILEATIEGYRGSSQCLAVEIGNLSYDRTADFLGNLKEAMQEIYSGNNAYDGVMDNLDSARSEMLKAWRICEPYMAD